jgi:hypothetical protein
MTPVPAVNLNNFNLNDSNPICSNPHSEPVPSPSSPHSRPALVFDTELVNANRLRGQSAGTLVKTDKR